jgi:uncharacterized protein YndB with AHSA1/START domain
MRNPCVTVVLILLSILAAPLRAEVLDAASNGFTVRHVLSIAATRETVYRAATQQVGAWWLDDHTLGGDASKLTMDTRTLGCFCEDLGGGAGVVHMIVTFVNPAVIIRLTGGLGPLGLMGLAGNMTWEFADDPTGTQLTLTYAVGGYLAGGLDPLAPAVDGVLLDQMTSLRAFVESSSISN